MEGKLYGLGFLWTYFLALAKVGLCFNIDTDIPVYKFGEANTQFGYSVAQHVQSTPNGTNITKILVGAPKAESGQTGTRQAGAVFSCAVNTWPHDNTRKADWCKLQQVEYRVILNPDNPSEPDPYSKTPDVAEPYPGRQFSPHGKDNQLLGSVISSGGEAGSGVVVCAPLARFRGESYTDGVCYVLDDQLQQVSHIHTCDSLYRKERHNQYGACLEGFSAIFDPQHKTIAVGAPGAWKWRGGVSAQFVGDDRRVTGKYTMESESAAVISSFSYLGFSVDMGYFGFGHEKKTDQDAKLRNSTLVSGASRDDETGAVYFMPFDPSNSLDYQMAIVGNSVNRKFLPFKLAGQRLTSAFGYAVKVLDIDMDTFDDLIVGAPFHYEIDEEQKTTSGGAIFIYFSIGRLQTESSEVFHPPIKILGEAGSGFGASLTALGDINRDELNDFAVGAPYAKGGGAVYIFHGAKREQLDTKPVQVIKAEDLKGRPSSKELRTFGWALSGGTDMDGNDYPDLLVGAYGSDAAILLRTRPIIHVETGAEYVAGASGKRGIDKDLGCGTLKAAIAQTCFSVRTTISVDLAGILIRRPRFTCYLASVPFQNGVTPRALFYNKAKNYSWSCGDSNTKETRIHQMHIPPENRDWLNPLKLSFWVELADKKKPEIPDEGGPLPEIDRFPVLDKKGATKELIIQFDKKCGDDDECTSDLKVMCEFKNLAEKDGVYVKHVNDDAFLNLWVSVRNLAERAYDSQLYMFYDSHELEVPQLTSSQGSSRLVSLGVIKENLVTVLLGNPFEGVINDQIQEVRFTLSFRLARGSSQALGSALEFVGNVNSTSNERNDDDNGCSAEVKVIKQAELILEGKSVPQLVYFGGKVRGESAMEYEEDIGPAVTHQYFLNNEGPWSVSNLSVLIRFPYEVQSPFDHGKWALYPMEYPVAQIPVPGQSTPQTTLCQVDRLVADDVINPLELKINTAFSLSYGAFSLRPAIGESRKRSKRKSVPDSSASKESGKEELRQKRQLRISPETEMRGREKIRTVTLSCEKRTAKCFQIKCHFPFLEAKASATMEIRARLWNSTFVSDYSDVHTVSIISDGEIKLDPRQGVEETFINNNFAQVKTVALPDMPKIVQQVHIPIWIIVVSVIGGIFLLFLIVVICWKCGFFKRKRRHEQPLYKAEFKTGEEWTET